MHQAYCNTIQCGTHLLMAKEKEPKKECMQGAKRRGALLVSNRCVSKLECRQCGSTYPS